MSDNHHDRRNHAARHAKYQNNLDQAKATIAKQGRTIHQLRSELAEIREQHSKIERYQLKQLERENQNLKYDVELYVSRLTKVNGSCKALREENARLTARAAANDVADALADQ
jgi:septal ring factor EnvC (AmiA/AmiB activator)